MGRVRDAEGVRQGRTGREGGTERIRGTRRMGGTERQGGTRREWGMDWRRGGGRAWMTGGRGDKPSHALHLLDKQGRFSVSHSLHSYYFSFFFFWRAFFRTFGLLLSLSVPSHLLPYLFLSPPAELVPFSPPSALSLSHNTDRPKLIDKENQSIDQ